jgi:branched-chain amino acid transport system permease protein
MFDYVVSIATTAGINAILAMGLAILTAYAGYISIAAGAMAGIGAYVYAVLCTSFGFPTWSAAAIAVAACSACGLLVSEVVSRLRGEIHLLGTLALQLVVIETLRRWRSVTGGDAGISGVPTAMPGMSQGSLGLLVLVVAVLLAIVLHVWLTGPAGLRLRAIRDDHEAAASCGCSVRRETRMAFAVSGGVMGCAGVLVAMYHSFLQPVTFGMDWSISILLMVMLGGANIAGCFAAAVFLSLLPEAIYLVVKVPGLQVGAVQNVVYGAVLLALMMFRAKGLFPETRARAAGRRPVSAGRMAREAS